MSASTTDDALARLNYINGQRLTAADLRAEQNHHVAMRRVLNRSLYSAGIVAGLEVAPDGSDTHRVVVHAGLAFDTLGREIYLPADVSVLVNGTPASAPGVLFGNLLVVSYREQRALPVSTGCTAGAPYRACGGQPAWGAPTRVLADAVFEVLDAWPAADSGKVVLAQIEFSPTCTVVRCAPGVRKYAVPVKAGKTRVLSLAGDGDVAPGAPKVLHFHVADGLPERATLYLRGGSISPLWYSELARHSHSIEVTVDGNPWTVDLFHEHFFEGEMAESGKHRHSYHKNNVNDTGGVRHGGTAWQTDPDDFVVAETDSANAINNSGDHTHDLSALKISAPAPLQYELTPDFSHSTVGEKGMAPGVRPGQQPYSYFKSLTVKLDGTDVTDKILEQLPALAQLGVGESTTPDDEPFVADGTAAIDLLLLGIDLLPRAHTLEFTVPEHQGGGKLFYALYID